MVGKKELAKRVAIIDSDAPETEEAAMNFENLTPEQMEMARACKSSEELAALAAKVGIEISDEELEGFSGGSWATDCPKEGCIGYRDEPEECKQFRCYHHGDF